MIDLRKGLSRGRAVAAMAALSGIVFVAGNLPANAADPQNRIQLQVFQIKVVDAKGVQGQMPVGVYIDTPNRKATNDVCGIAPRLRDALNTHLRKQTYPLDAKGNLQNVGAMSTAARPVVEGAVDKDNVVGVEIKQGAPSVKASAASMFQKSGCIGVADAIDQPKGAPKSGGEHGGEPKAAH